MGRLEGPHHVGRNQGGGGHEDLLSKRVILPEAAIGMTDAGGWRQELSQRKLPDWLGVRRLENRLKHQGDRPTPRNEGEP